MIRVRKSILVSLLNKIEALSQTVAKQREEIFDVERRIKEDFKLKQQQLSDRLATLLEDGISASAPTHQHSLKDSSRGNEIKKHFQSRTHQRGKSKVGKPKERLTNTTSSTFYTASASCKITAITSMLTRGEKPVPEKEDSPLH